jgi:hypothetical protein
MTGGLMQLVAYGAQDIYLTGNPMITYFKVVYRRHTNFALESIEQTFNGTADFGNKVSCLISRNGDLLSGLAVEATLPNITFPNNGAGNGAGAGVAYGGRWVDNIGHYLIQEVSVEIGGQLIDRHYSDWMEIWAQLTMPTGHKAGYRSLIGQDPKDSIGQPTGLQQVAAGQGSDIIGGVAANTALVNGGSITGRKLHVPLQFWFCRNVGLALPLIALQYHEVKVNVTFAPSNNLVSLSSGPVGGTFTNAFTLSGGLSNVSLWADYIYLDTDERRRFAQVSHEYLIEQVQYSGSKPYTASTGGTDNQFDLHFNHPVKHLLWVARMSESESGLPMNDSRVDLAERLTINLNQNQWSNFTHRVAQGRSVTNNLNSVDGIRGTDLTGNVAPVTTSVHESPSASRLVDFTSGQDMTNPEGNAVTLVQNATLRLNGHDRFAQRDGEYFTLLQKHQHWGDTASPGIHLYSFALKPEDHQPSGTCNFSRIDNAQLNLNMQHPIAGGIATSFTTGTVHIYAMNYNVLRIMSGMGGLAYSN